jgi:hypothetical protein
MSTAAAVEDDFVDAPEAAVAVPPALSLELLPQAASARTGQQAAISTA